MLTPIDESLRKGYNLVKSDAGKMDHPTPEQEFSVDELCSRYELSKQSLYERLKAIGVKGYKKKGCGNSVFFSPEMVFQLDFVDKQLLQGTTLRQLRKVTEEFRNGGIDAEGSDDAEEKVIDIGTTYSMLEETDKKTAATSEALISFEQREKQAQALATAFTTAVGNALKDTQAVVGDPLLSHRRLAEAAKEEYFLSTKQLAEILGITNATINKWGGKAIRNGFVLKKVADGYWIVEKATLEQLTQPDFD
jgi:DNA-binding transcriptional regulator YiaG